MQFVTGLSKCLQLVVRGADVINDMDRLWGSDEFHGIAKASLATRTTLLFLSIAEISFELANQGISSKARLVKNCEVIVRTVDTPIQALDAIIEMAEDNNGLIGKIRIFEKKILSSCLGVARANVESDLKLQQYYLSLSPEEQSKIQIPVYKYDPVKEEMEIVDYRPFDLKECQISVASLEKLVPKLSVAETVTLLQIGSTITGISIKAFELLTQRIVARGQNPRLVMPHHLDINEEVDINEEDQESVDLERICDLKNLNFIPVELEEDEVFKQFTCAISFRPIRHIVADPTADNKVYYERQAILAWLNRQHTSPATRRTLLASQLTPCIAIQALIDKRLALYSDALKSKIQEIIQTPINQDEIDAAIQEIQT